MASKVQRSKPLKKSVNDIPVARCIEKRQYPLNKMNNYHFSIMGRVVQYDIVYLWKKFLGRLPSCDKKKGLLRTQTLIFG